MLERELQVVGCPNAQTHQVRFPCRGANGCQQTHGSLFAKEDGSVWSALSSHIVRICLKEWPDREAGAGRG